MPASIAGSYPPDWEWAGGELGGDVGEAKLVG